MENDKMIKTVIEENNKCLFLSKQIKNYALFESAVYYFSNVLSSDYSGGMWDFIKISNKAFYMKPHCDDSFNVTVTGNYFDEKLSSDAFGIVVTLFALNYVAQKPNNDDAIDKYYLLMDYVDQHSDASKIFRAIN